MVALIVIGPEKLPRVARMAGTLYGRAQRYLHEVKSEVSREIELDELRSLHQEVKNSAQSIRDEVHNTISGTWMTSSMPCVTMSRYRARPARGGSPLNHAP